MSNLRLLLHSRGEQITITASSCRPSRAAMSDFLVDSNTEDAHAAAELTGARSMVPKSVCNYEGQHLAAHFSGA